MSFRLLDLLLLLIVIEGLTECQMIRNNENFQLVTSWLNGSPLCAADVPTIAVPVDSLDGIPSPVPNVVRCGFACTGFSNCISFNYVVSPVAQCELYTFVPRNCTSMVSTGSNCRHFEVNVRRRVPKWIHLRHSFSYCNRAAVGSTWAYVSIFASNAFFFVSGFKIFFLSSLITLFLQFVLMTSLMSLQFWHFHYVCRWHIRCSLTSVSDYNFIDLVEAVNDGLGKVNSRFPL